MALPRVPPLEVLVAEPRALQNLVGRETRRHQPGRDAIFDADPVLFWRLKPDLREVIWAGTLVSTDAQGFRSDRGRAARAEGTRRRIVCLGDSVTFGYQIPFVSRERPDDYDREARAWPAQLETQLEAQLEAQLETQLDAGLRRPGFEVIPLAVPGYTSYQGLALLEQQLPRLAPELVVIAFGWNDADLRPQPDRLSMPRGPLDVASRRAVLASQMLTRAAAWLRRGSPPARAGDAEPQPRVAVADFVSNHLQLARLAETGGAHALVIGPLYRDPVTDPAAAARIADRRAALAGAARAAGVAYLEVPELTEAGHPGNAGLFLEEIHPSVAGHALLASAVHRELRARGWLTPHARAFSDHGIAAAHAR